MADFRRYFVPGSMVFLTVVTYQRRPILTTDAGRRLLRVAIQGVRTKRPFNMFALALLPDHWHFLMQLPSGDADYSTRVKRIKEDFTVGWLAEGRGEAEVTAFQAKRGERGIWQPRFWEHTIRDPNDMERCVDYIHWNPRKHQLVSRVKDWPWSSFHRFAKEGQYDINWGGEQPKAIKSRSDWGEPA